MVRLKDFNVGDKVYRVKEFKGVVREGKPIEPEIKEFEVVSVGKKYVTINVSAYECKFMEHEKDYLRESIMLGEATLLFKTKEDAKAYLQKQELVKWLNNLSFYDANQLSVEQLQKIKDIVDGKTVFLQKVPQRVCLPSLPGKEIDRQNDKLYNCIDKYTNNDSLSVKIYNILRRNGYCTAEDLLELDGDAERIRLMRNCGETSARIIEGVIADLKIKEEEKRRNMKKIKFCDIEESKIAIHFTNTAQLEKLVDYLKAYGYDYGTGKQGKEYPLNNMDRIKDLGVHYFGKDNMYLTLDRSKKHHPRNYVSCGLGAKAKKYNFSSIDWNIT